MKILIEIPGQDPDHPEAIANCLAFIHNMVHIHGAEFLVPFVKEITDEA